MIPLRIVAAIASTVAICTASQVANASTSPLSSSEVEQFFGEQDLLWSKVNLSPAEVASNSAMINYNSALQSLGKQFLSETHTVISSEIQNSTDVSAEIHALVAYHLVVRDIASAKMENLDETDTHILIYLIGENGWKVTSDEVVPMQSDSPSGLPPTTEQPSQGNFEPIPHPGFKIQSRMLPPDGGGYGPMGSLNYTAMATYALLWTDATHANLMNPAYPDEDNDCTNFVSQALNVGGWATRDGGLLSNNRDTTIWSYKMVSPVFTKSFTWVNADYLFTFMKQVAHLPVTTNASLATVGDIIFFDWDPNLVPDGSMDHALVVTQVDADGTIHISQKSANEHNMTMAAFMVKARSQGHLQIKSYVVRT